MIKERGHCKFQNAKDLNFPKICYERQVVEKEGAFCDALLDYLTAQPPPPLSATAAWSLLRSATEECLFQSPVVTRPGPLYEAGRAEAIIAAFLEQKIHTAWRKVRGDVLRGIEQEAMSKTSF